MLMKMLNPHETINGQVEFIGRELEPTQASVTRHENNQVTLSIYFIKEERPEIYEWHTNSILGLTPTPETKEHFLPPHLLFRGEGKVITFIDCQAFNVHFFDFPLQGAHKGIIGAQIVAFGEPHLPAPGNLYGIGAEIEGLFAWTEQRVKRGEYQPGYLVSYNANPPEKLSFPSVSDNGDDDNKIFFNISTSGGQESFSAQHFAQACSKFQKETSWRDGFTFIEALQELLTISGDRYAKITALTVKITPDTGDEREDLFSWVPALHQYKDTEPEPLEKPRSLHCTEYLIRLHHLGTEGFAKWAQVRKDYARVIAPLMNLYKLKDSTVDQEILLTGIALEALAYNLRLRKDDWEETKAAGEKLYRRFPRIVEELSPIHAEHLIGSWATDMKDAYNGVKHANREIPAINELAELADLSKTVLRAWLALELGIKPSWVTEKLRDRFRSSKYTLRPDPSELLP